MGLLNNSITDVPGVLVGHEQNDEALTGCTVIICEEGATGGVDQRGGASGTRETDALRPMHLVNHVHAVMLAGGSAFGLDAATGAMKYLEEKGIGFDTQVAKVPIVASAILYDLAIGRSDIRPNAEMGYQACMKASSQPPKQGNYGAGTGATVGKILGMDQAMKSGIGTASVEIGNGIIIGAIVAVNAFGDVVDPKNGEIIAGVRAILSTTTDDSSRIVFANTLNVMKGIVNQPFSNISANQNTVIGTVATNAMLTKEEANKVAQMAQNGLALTIRPTHTMLDGDTIFVMATNKFKVDVNVIGAFAVQVVAAAIINGIKYTKPINGFPSYNSV